ncbi:unnamed protein product, partial [Closterium sp. NIES-53]
RGLTTALLLLALTTTGTTPLRRAATSATAASATSATASATATSAAKIFFGGPLDRQSRTGYIFRLEPIGPISWNSWKQELVSLSSVEAEFIAACAATREGLYLQELLDEAKFITPNQFTLQCDNQSAITIANKPGFVNRTKHISLRYFFVKDAIDKGRMRLVYCPTDDMAADSLTKKLTRQKFHHCNQLSGISETTG